MRDELAEALAALPPEDVVPMEPITREQVLKLAELAGSEVTYTEPGLGDPEGNLPSKWFYSKGWSAGCPAEGFNEFLASGLDLLVIAAPLTSELTEAVWQRLKIPVKQGYGLSESSPVVTCQTVDEWAKFMGSCGKMMPNMEAKLVDEEGREVADGEVCTFCPDILLTDKMT